MGKENSKRQISKIKQMLLESDKQDDKSQVVINSDDMEIKSLNEILLNVAKVDGSKVLMDGNLYPAWELIKLIIDLDIVKIIWHREDGIYLKAREDYQKEYNKFKQDYLLENKQILIRIFKVSYKKYLKQVKYIEKKAKSDNEDIKDNPTNYIEQKIKF